jgi:hypothetical protein
MVSKCLTNHFGDATKLVFYVRWYLSQNTFGVA